jgi:predicted RNase H-like nuclease (RuvC/YqgF family)
MDWGTFILAVLGGGGFVALVNALANRKKVAAEAHKLNREADELAAKAESLLIEKYKDRLLRLDQRANDQDKTIDEMRSDICLLRDEIRSRDQKIEELESLKTMQQQEILKLQEEVKERDRRISDQARTIEHLALRVTELESTLKRLQDGKSTC